LQPTQRELDAVNLALQGVPLQFFAIPPLAEDSTAAQLSFIAAVRDEAGNLAGALVARTRLNANPFAQPEIQSLDSIADLGGQALLLDGDGRIVYSPTGVSLLADYSGQRSETALNYQDVGPDGARRQVLYQPARGSAWAVVAQVPASLAQQLALSIVWPVLLVLLVLALIAYGLLRLSLRSVTGGLGDLAREAHRIAGGDLDAPLSVRGADEVGQLGQAFESMRKRLKQRQDENQRLLSVSQQVAGSLEMRSQIDPILEAALAGGASSARMVFGSASDVDSDLVGFGRGELSEAYASLDAQVLPMTRTQARVLLTNPARARLQMPAGAPALAALAAFALNHEGDHLGALWLAYDAAQFFPAESVRYLETLAGQAALAAANARLYLNARIGRQRMEAILAATPDPVLVSDQTDRLLLANPAAMTLLGIEHLPVQGSRVDQVIESPDLLALLTGKGPASGEVHLRSDQVYYATVTPVEIDGEVMGRACVLRDITQFKQSEEMGSEFLSAVSHDLRDPLEKISNALTMLGMVGELNARQEGYAEEIADTAQSMDNLIGNLLNLQRIEGGQGLQLQATDVLALLHEVRDSLQARARQKQIDIVIEQPNGSLPPAAADPALLRQAFYNLMDNAIRFSSRGKPVQVGVKTGSDNLLVEISDQGAGIAPVDLPHIFERMYRPSGSAEAGNGGLGLAIVKSVVERHRGRVWADSELGAGSRFYVEIPLDSDFSS
jgi:two-component system NtrC family sensor kinase